MRKREAIQPRKLNKVEADVFLKTAGRNALTDTRGRGRFHRGQRAWRVRKVKQAYLGGLTGSVNRKVKR